jgi:DNA invertase Pin-like site-specific DNA recombinase
MKHTKQAVIYARASTAKQANSIKLQEAVCRAFCESNELDVIGVWKETKSGASFDRPMFDFAVKQSIDEDAVLVATKVDRLARRISVIGDLLDQGVAVRVVQLGNQNVNELTLGIFASLAQAERSLIRTRTKAALAALKEKGVKLGNPNLADISASGRAAHALKAKRFNYKLAQEVADIQRAGIKTNAGIAECLNRRGFKTVRGKSFTAPNVARIRRAAA